MSEPAPESTRSDPPNRPEAPMWVVIAIAALALIFGFSVGWALHTGSAISVSSSHQSSTIPTATDSLGNQKTRADIQLEQAQRSEALQQAESAQAGNAVWRQLLTPAASFGAALLAAIVAFLAIVIPLRNQRRDDRLQRAYAAAKDISQRNDVLRKEVEQRQKDRAQLFDDRFATAVRALADDKPSVQVTGAAALLSYQPPDLKEFVAQVFLVVRANLAPQIPHPESVRRLLVAALSKALSTSPPASEGRATIRKHSIGRGDGPDLARTWMRGADFRGTDLSSADIAFSDLKGARLDGASLRRGWGWGVNLSRATLRSADLEEGRFQNIVAPGANFDKARLVSARLENARLSGARFRGALLQSAHFNNAQLDGTDFRGANVSDTFFEGAKFDDSALKSLALSATWRALSSPYASDEEWNKAVTLMRSSLDDESADRLLGLTRGKGWSGTGSAPPEGDTPTHSANS